MWPAALTRYVTGSSKLRELVGPGAAGAAPAAAAPAATTRLRREVGEGGRSVAAAGESEARDQHARLRRLASRANLGAVALGEPGQDFELPSAALAPILVDGHLYAGF